MTTPLEAQELAKRLRALAAQIDPCLIGGPDARLLNEAVAFLEHPVQPLKERPDFIAGYDAGLHDAKLEAAEHPVNTGHGVTLEMVQAFARAAEMGNGDLTSEDPTLERIFANTRKRITNGLCAALAARTPLASVEGEWCPDWTLSDQDKTAVALTLALSKHIPDWPGATDDQLADVAKAVLSALAQSGRSSAEPVAWQYRVMHDTEDRWWEWHDTTKAHFDRLNAARKPRVETRALYAAPPVGPQEAVVVKARVFVVTALAQFGSQVGWRSRTVGADSKDEAVGKGLRLFEENEPERQFSVPDAIEINTETLKTAGILSTLSPSSTDLGGEDRALHAESVELLEAAVRDIEYLRPALVAAEARLATAEKALTPFASIGEMIAEHGVASDDQRVEESVYTVALDQVMKLTLGDFRRAREVLASLSTNAVREGDWQSIETAPKDDIIWLANENIMRLGFWQEGEKHENHGTVGGGWIDKALAEAGGVRGLTFAPTLWHPCPTFPRPSPPNGDAP